MRSIKEILMSRDGCTEEDALEQIAIAMEELYEHLEAGRIDAAESICEDHFGLEPDYLDQLI